MTNNRIFPPELVPQGCENFRPAKECDIAYYEIKAGESEMCFVIDEEGDSYALDQGALFCLSEPLPKSWISIVASVAEVAWRKLTEKYNMVGKTEYEMTRNWETWARYLHNAFACREWAEEGEE